MRPGFIYGKTGFNGVDIVGKPLERALAAAASLTRPLQKLPASDLLLAPPVDVDDDALAAIRALQDDYHFGISSLEKIKEMAKA